MRSWGAGRTRGIAAAVVALATTSIGLGETLLTAPPAGAASPSMTWTVNETTPASSFTSVSCPSATICEGVGRDGSGLAILGSPDGGTTWSSQQSLGSDFDGAISCFSTTICEVATNGGAIFGTTNGGATWAPQAAPTKDGSLTVSDLTFYDVSCGSSTTCVAAASWFDPGTPNSVGVSGSAITTNGGTSWTLNGIGAWVDGVNPGYLVGISCISATTCEAVGYVTIAASGGQTAGVLFRTANGGGSWTTQTVPSSIGDFDNVSCASTTCIATGEQVIDNGPEVVVGTTDGGADWAVQTASGLSELAGVACASTTNCEIASGTDSGDSAIWGTTDSGTTWTAQTISDLDESGQLSAISCASTTQCVAVGEAVVLGSTGPAKQTPTMPSVSNVPSAAAVGGSFTASVSTTGDGAKSVTSNSTTVCTVSGLMVTYVGPGTCSLTAHVAGGTNYNGADGSPQTFTVSKGTPSSPVISNLPGSGVIGGNFTATVSTNGDGSTSVTSSTTGICTVSGLLVTYVASGTCTLTAHVAAGTDYAAANGTAQNLAVTQPPAPYSPLAPTRICDTRAGNPSGLTAAPATQCDGSANSGSTIASAGVETISVAGSFGVPSNATAVVLNVTAANPTGSGYVTAYPAGATRPTTSTLNDSTGVVVPNLVEVGLGSNGDVSFYSSNRTDLIVDLEGYTDATALGGAGSGLYNALAAPTRICDTRAGNPSALSGSPYTQCNGTNNGGQTLVAGSVLAVRVTGASTIPSGATAAVLNVTATGAQAAGFLTVYPQGTSRPTSSNLNYRAGVTSANRVVVPLSGSGAIDIYSSAGTDVVVDVSGYYSAAGGTGAEFTAEPAPVRVCDTRPGNPSGLVSPYTQCNGQTIAAGGSVTFSVRGLAGVPAGATAVVLNLTGIQPSTNTYLTVYPGPTRPTASDVNPAQGTVRANMVVATVNPSTGDVTIYNHAGTVNVAVDVEGWSS